MIKNFKRVKFLFVLLKSNEAFFEDLADAVADAVAPEHECILPNTWTEWVEHGTCETVTRKRNYKYYMCEFEILSKPINKVIIYSL